MRISILIVLALFSSLVSAAPDIKTWQTDNGAEVYFVESHELGMVDLQIVFDAGSSRDGDKPGLALITNHLLAHGAGGMNADEISYGFESLGAIYDGSAGYDSASAKLRSLSEETKLSRALENLVRVISQPDFPQSAFERERNRMLIGIQSKKQSPGALASDAFYAAVYEDHPYALPNEGTEESLQSISLEDIRAFHQRYYVANNAVIAIVGDLTRAQAKALANRLSASLPAGEKPQPLADVSPLNDAKAIHIEHPSTQMHILMGQPGIRRGDPDYFVLYVGNHILGGGGMISRLFAEVREKRGLSYSAYSYFNPMRQPGPFVAGLQTKTDQADEAVTVLKDTLKEFIDHGPTQEELQASKKNITGGFPLRIDSNSKILGYLGVIGFYDLPLDYLDTFNDKIEAVTVGQIKDAFKRRLSLDKFVTVKVGPKDGEDGGES